MVKSKRKPKATQCLVKEASSSKEEKNVTRKRRKLLISTTTSDSGDVCNQRPVKVGSSSSRKRYVHVSSVKQEDVEEEKNENEILERRVERDWKTKEEASPTEECPLPLQQQRAMSETVSSVGTRHYSSNSLPNNDTYRQHFILPNANQTIHAVCSLSSLSSASSLSIRGMTENGSVTSMSNPSISTSQYSSSVPFLISSSSASTSLEALESTASSASSSMVCSSSSVSSSSSSESFLDNAYSLTRKEKNDIVIPPEFRCAITGLIMIEPVSTCDGQVYEREAIERWLEEHNTSPLTGKVLDNKILTPNLFAKVTIQSFLEQNREFLNSEEIYSQKSLGRKLMELCQRRNTMQVLDIIQNNHPLLTTKFHDLKNKNIMHLLCEFGKPKMIDEVFQVISKKDKNLFSELMKQKDDDDWNPFQLALLARNKEVFEHLGKMCLSGQILGDFLLNLGVNQASKIQQQLDELLLDSSMQGNLDLVQVLLKFRADVEVRNEKHNTPLMLASFFGKKKVVEFLLKSNANIEARGELGFTPLTFASQEGHNDVVECLLKYSANVQAQSNVGSTPLGIAALRNNKETVLILLRHNADLNARTCLGNTPLIFAATNGHKDTVEILLDAGADFSITNNEGKTAIDCAQTPELAEFIKKKVDQQFPKLKKSVEQLEKQVVLLQQQTLQQNELIQRLLSQVGDKQNAQH